MDKPDTIEGLIEFLDTLFSGGKPVEEYYTHFESVIRGIGSKSPVTRLLDRTGDPQAVTWVDHPEGAGVVLFAANRVGDVTTVTIMNPIETRRLIATLEDYLEMVEGANSARETESSE